MIFEGIALLIVIAAVGWLWVKRFGLPWRHHPEINPDAPYRLLVAVKRRQAGVMRFLELDSQMRNELLAVLDDQLRELDEVIRKHARFIGGYKATGISRENERWPLLAFYDLNSYDKYRECVSVLDADKFTDLRNYCDIDMVLGDRKDRFEGDIKELF
jgi:hypothetical protein